MGLRDAEEMLEAAKDDVLRLERENDKLRAVIARVADYAASEVEDASGEDRDYARGKLTVAAATAALVDQAADGSARADLSPLSPIRRYGVPQTWQQVAQDLEQRVADGDVALSILSDLDRNRHGRHEGDSDTAEPGTISLGNPHLTRGQTLGYTLGGAQRIVMPPRQQQHDPRAWLQPRS